MSSTPGAPPPPPGDGGAPPPPPGDGGGTPPPPPAGGHGSGSGSPGGNAIDLGAAFRFGWAKFQENVGPILIGLIGLLLIVGVIGFVWFFVVGAAMGTGSDAGFFIGLLATVVGSFVFLVGGFFIQAVFVRAGFDLIDGRGLETSRLFSTEQIGPILVASLLVALGTAIGQILCYIPGIIFAVLSAFTLHFVIDEGLAPVDAIKASIDLVRENLGSAVALILVVYVVTFVGALLCGVGLLVALPVATIATAYGFRQLRGRVVPNV